MHISSISFTSLFIQMRQAGENIASGTAFLALSAKGPVLITNRHNVTGLNNLTGDPINGRIPDEVIIVHNKKGSLGTWIYTQEPLYNGKRPLWLEHPVLGSTADFVALPLTQINDVEIYPYTLANHIPIKVSPSDRVDIIGFPFGKTGGGSLPIWVTGFIATEPEIDYDNLPVFLIDSRTRPGQSGSPVISYRNSGTIILEDDRLAVAPPAAMRFLGIYSGRINPQSDLGMVWKAEAIKKLVESIV
jgi:hypothetical protein